MENNENLHFFEKLETNEDSEVNVNAPAGYFTNFLGQIFRSEPNTQQNEEISAQEDSFSAEDDERKKSEESLQKDDVGFQNTFNERFNGLMKIKGIPKLKNYNESNFKQYWMPDSTGRECYQCEEKFTILRRRHHCRLCGQIFCAKCCNSHIDGASLGYMGELRLCDFCTKKVQRLSKDAEIEIAQPLRKNSSVSLSQKKSWDSQLGSSKTSSTGVLKTVSSGAIWSLCPTETLRASETRQTCSSINNIQRNPSSQKSSGELTILSVQDLLASTSTASEKKEHSLMSSLINEEEESGPDWFRSMNPGMDGVINNETSDSSDVFAYANMTSGPVSNKLGDTVTNLKNDRKITFPSLCSEETIATVVKNELRDNLEEQFERNTIRMLGEILKRENICEEKWQDVLLDTSKKIANNVLVNVVFGDSMNVANYVHVKKLAAMDESFGAEIIWGVVCSKSLLQIDRNNEKDQKKNSNESIMIVGGSIEYERVSSKLSSIEPIIVQEEKFLERQIERISSKRASLILVEGGVSRLAAQLLEKKNIKIAVNVKLAALKRISRATGADIVSNSDAQLIDQNLGFCPEFSQRQIKTKNGKMKTLMVFGDCQKEAGCTVLIRGNNKEELKAVKRVLLFLITIVYSNKLEQTYLNAFNTSIARRQSNCVVCENRREVIYAQREKTLFEHQLEIAMLSSSPIIEFEPPFLETMIGRNSPLILYFKQPLYKLLDLSTEPKDLKAFVEEDAIEQTCSNVIMERHAFGELTKGSKLHKLIKTFRAFSGINFNRRIRSRPKSSNMYLQQNKFDFRAKDVLDPRLHQTLAVLFGSFSRKSPNAPYFCVRPWVVSMNYYKDNDMTLGEFLTKYCFNKNYECPSSNCEVSMLEHSRKLVFGRVCVEISTQLVSDAENSFENDEQNAIVTWRNCAKCNISSQMVKFNHNLWHLSFAKFLDYLGNSCFTTETIYPGRNISNQCSHCFFHEKLYFFAMENLVTSFKVNPIKPYQVLFSSIRCFVKIQKVNQSELSDDIENIVNLTLGVCEKANAQLADLDEDAQSLPAIVKLATLIRNSMDQAGKSKSILKSLLQREETLIQSNDKLFWDVTDAFMKTREATHTLISMWNETMKNFKYSNKPEDSQDFLTVQKLENPFPSYLHLSIKLQPRIGVVVRDISDSRGNIKPDIGSIIAYALSAADYSKLEKKKVDDRNNDSSSSSQSFKDNGNTGEDISSEQHLEVEFEDDGTSYYVKVFYAEKFRKLRELLIVEGEETFIRSLSNSLFWTPQGGKSGSFFYRTQDDRFVVKQMTRFEIQSFLKFAPNYFDYLTTAAMENKLTTLCKVYGVFRIGYKSKTTTLKVDILVMEYLFYNHNVSQVWDLKGSLRNRMASTVKSNSDLVLLDENFVKDLWNQQLYVFPHSKAALNQAISNDSHFLSSQYIMDYSLLVGVDDNNGELILGIVDYMRTYTLDKKLESWVKIVAIPGAHLPTILSPEMYCARFSEAIDSYFPVIPDQWTGLGSVRSF